MNGDLNNTSAMREVQNLEIDSAFSYRSLALSEEDDDELVRKAYRPFILNSEITAGDWISKLELSTVVKMSEENIQKTGERLKVLVLYGSLRQRCVSCLPPWIFVLNSMTFRSYSRLLAFEASRILFRLGCDVRVFNPAGLPVKDDAQQSHHKVQELRDLSRWSDGHMWISAEQHGNLVRP
jgi:arsenical resistance protein ArsH